MVDTFTAPTEAERRAHPSARVAHWANVLVEARRLTEVEGNPLGIPEAVYGRYALAMCSVCGGNANSWCDDCESAGRSFRSVYGNPMVGSAVCHPCDNAGQCGVCLRHLH